MRGALFAVAAEIRLFSRSPLLSPLRRFVGRIPIARRIARRLDRASTRFLTGDQPRVWVQVQGGIAKGLWMYLDLNWEVSYWIGMPERGVQDTLRGLTAPGSVFYDVGGHVGFYSLGVAEHIGPSGKVFVFEADPENASRLNQHIARNGLLDRIRIIEKAVWSSSKEVSFRRSKRDHTQGGIDAPGYTAPFADGEKIVVKAVTLDAFVEAGHPPPDVVKIDVEGAEAEVLRGAERVFARARPALLCEVHHPEAAVSVQNWLSARGYASGWLSGDSSFPRHLVARRPPSSP